jgi:multiple antibiotic resistance protein|tara:strand:- start:3293 stop:3931 length:639 start_codon:yes stop_codon:yes gene_type:complete
MNTIIEFFMSTILELLKYIGLSFIPLFVAVDAVGNLPIIASLTHATSSAERRRVIRYAIITALILGLGFIGIGRGLLFILGIETSDFLIAGGLVLFILTVRRFTTGKLVDPQSGDGKEMIGVAPIGTPLVVGPAVLTTLLLLTGQYPLLPVLLAFILNLAFTWGVFAQADRMARIMREPGLRAASQFASLLLAVIAVMMVRKGLLEILGQVS